MAKILIVYHSRTGNTKKMAHAVTDVARSIEGVKVVKKVEDAVLEDLSADRKPFVVFIS